MKRDGMLQWAVVALFCLGAVMVVGQGEVSEDVLWKKLETVNSIPSEYGRLLTVVRSPEGTVLYFEAADGTSRFVSVVYGIDHRSLKFRALTVPRSM